MVAKDKVIVLRELHIRPPPGNMIPLRVRLFGVFTQPGSRTGANGYGGSRPSKVCRPRVRGLDYCAAEFGPPCANMLMHRSNWQATQPPRRPTVMPAHNWLAEAVNLPQSVTEMVRKHRHGEFTCGFYRVRPVSIRRSPCGCRTSTAVDTESRLSQGEPPRYAKAAVR
jgi:hypothetical protein